MPTHLSLIDSGKLRTKCGEFDVDIFTLANQEVVVLRTAEIGTTPDRIPFCRIQSECIGHMFQDLTCDCADQLRASLTKIAAEGHGLLIYLRQEGMDLGLSARLGNSKRDARNYLKACLILSHYRIRSIHLLSINKKRIIELEAENIKVADFEYPWSEGKTLILSERINRVISQVQDGASFPLVSVPSPSEKRRILILGDLNVDMPLFQQSSEQKHTAAGTGLNAARAFNESEDFTPMIFGRVGDDLNGKLIRSAIARERIYSFIGIRDDKSTGVVRHTMGPQGQKVYVWEKKDNANDYDLHNLENVLALTQLGRPDFALVVSYLFVQKSYNSLEINAVLKALTRSSVRIILDFTRWSVDPAVFTEVTGKEFSTEDFKKTLTDCLAGIELFCIIGEMYTFLTLQLTRSSKPDKANAAELLKFFRAKWVVCRFSNNGKMFQYIAMGNEAGQGDPIPLPAGPPQNAPQESTRIGSGDQMFLQALREITAYEERL